MALIAIAAVDKLSAVHRTPRCRWWTALRLSTMPNLTRAALGRPFGFDFFDEASLKVYRHTGPDYGRTVVLAMRQLAFLFGQLPGSFQAPRANGS
jgi:hypothetical protein